jgi:aerobic-type carbon monoxide dehydrogenase small subunit (CoxS/CutS family)
VVRLSPVQQAFIEHYAFQCGYCTPGFVTGATVLMDQLKRAPVSRKDLERVIEDALGPHICRCTGYVRYYAAVRQLIVDTPGLIAR